MIDVKDFADVLVVEDNILDQKLLAAYLTEYDISCFIAANGKEALEIIANADFKLVLLDIGLPELDGYAVARKMRQELNITIPIVAITAYNIDEVKDQCFAAGMNACFEKPIGRVALVGILTQFLPDKVGSEDDHRASDDIN